MSAVLLAVFNDYETAERVRVILVRDGFPTDRVELTASCDLGRAALPRNARPTFRELSSDHYRASAWCDRDGTCDRDSSASSSGRRGGTRSRESRMGARGCQA